MKTRMLFALAFAALLAFPALAATTPNLLNSATFDSPTAIGDWPLTLTRAADDSTAFPAVGWVGIDALGSPNSGSMSLSGNGGILQCVAVTGGKTYDFGGRIRIAKSASAHINLDFFADRMCLSPSLGEAQSEPADTAAPGRFVAVAGSQTAPDGAQSAMVTIVVSGASTPVLIDDMFLQEHGGCAPDTHTLCLAGGKIRATAVYHGPKGEAIAAPVMQQSNSSGYFFTNSADQAEFTIKTIDLSEGGDGKWITIGGLTNLQLEIKVEDLVLHQQHDFANKSGHFLEPIVDVFTSP